MAAISDGTSVVTCVLLAGIAYQLHQIREAMPTTRAEIQEAADAGDDERWAKLHHKAILVEGNVEVTTTSFAPLEIEGSVTIDGVVPVETSGRLIDGKWVASQPLKVEIAR